MSNIDTKQLNDIEKKVESLRRRLTREVALTVVLGLLMLIAVCAYFTYGYTQIDQLLRPQMLVDLAGTMVQDQLPELRSNLEREVERNSPTWAEELSRQAIASVPEVRKQLEEHIIGQVDVMVAETVNVTGPEVQKFLQTNKAEISRAIAELQKDDKVLSDQSLADIEKALSDTLQTDMKAQAKQALQTLQEIAMKGEQLKSGNGLSEFDARLRDIVMILRRFHLREKGI
jgi:hypothetical protein